MLEHILHKNTFIVSKFFKMLAQGIGDNVFVAGRLQVARGCPMLDMASPDSSMTQLSPSTTLVLPL